MVRLIKAFMSCASCMRPPTRLSCFHSMSYGAVAWELSPVAPSTPELVRQLTVTVGSGFGGLVRVAYDPAHAVPVVYGDQVYKRQSTVEFHMKLEII